MPSIRPTTPDSTSPMDRLNLAVASTRSAADPSSMYSSCVCFADGVEASVIYSQPPICFADEA